ncbi:hypothetical protein BS17DRAFT_763175 [Gyrodon lividus]|nr:hypothetical protein BS17DRAFT_763175 [Gyrodon lividus]
MNVATPKWPMPNPLPFLLANIKTKPLPPAPIPPSKDQTTDAEKKNTGTPTSLNMKGKATTSNVSTNQAASGEKAKSKMHLKGITRFEDFQAYFYKQLTLTQCKANDKEAMDLGTTN